MREVAEDVRSRDYEWLEPPVCEEAPRLCSGVFMANDYRSGEWIISPSPKQQWPLTVHFGFRKLRRWGWRCMRWHQQPC